MLDRCPSRFSLEQRMLLQGRNKYLSNIEIMRESKERILAFVTSLADRSHGDQVRKYTGERYVSHPIRVMETVRGYNDDVRVCCAALLHDVLEDTAVTQAEMKNDLLSVLPRIEAEQVMTQVVELTDVFTREDYPQINRRTRKHKEAQRLATISPEAQSIKYADIMDNVTDIVQQDMDFARVFVREAKQMLAVMNAGHPELRKKAIALVDHCLQDLQDPAELC